MFDDDLPKPKNFEFPRNLENLSIDDLKEYITDLKDEIARVEMDIDKKQDSKSAADSVFKI